MHISELNREIFFKQIPIVSYHAGGGFTTDTI